MIRLLIVEHVQNAYHSLKSTRLRTLLTTIGVAIGVASITTILSLSGGITQVVAGQVEALGGNISVIRPGAVQKDFDSFTNPAAEQTYITSTITEEDLLSIQEVKGVEAA